MSRNNTKSGQQCRVKTISLDDMWETPVQMKSITNPQLKSPQKKKKKKDEIHHDIFEECMEVVDDGYWKEIFEQASHNKFPRAFSFSGGFLIFKNAQKRKKVEVPESAFEAASVCISFFKEHGGLFSTMDRAKLEQYREENNDSQFLENCKWSDIKKTKVKTLLLEHFINNLATKYNMSMVDKLMLETTINTGFLLKFFDNKDVIFENGRIKDIKGLLYDEKSGNFIIDPSLEPLRLKSIKKSTTMGQFSGKSFSFIKSWNKFLKYLNTEYHSSQKLPIAIISKSDDYTDSKSHDVPESDITET